MVIHGVDEFSTPGGVRGGWLRCRCCTLLDARCSFIQDLPSPIRRSQYAITAPHWPAVSKLAALALGRRVLLVLLVLLVMAVSGAPAALRFISDPQASNHAP
jgi:hypothetical protein